MQSYLGILGYTNATVLVEYCHSGGKPLTDLKSNFPLTSSFPMTGMGGGSCASLESMSSTVVVSKTEVCSGRGFGA